MPTSTITGSIIDGAGTPSAGVVVYARLRPYNAARLSDGSTVANPPSTTTNGSGVYSFVLEQQANIAPAGSWWELEEDASDLAGGHKVRTVNVGAVNATVGQSEVTPAGLLGPSALTQAQGDLRYQTKGAQLVVDAKTDFGAKGDGTTDDAAALNAAVAAVSAAGGIVYCPPGTYLVKAQVTILSNVTLAGAGKDVTIIKSGAANVTPVQIATAGTNIRVERLTCHGNRTAFPSGTAVALGCSGGASDLAFVAVKVTNGQSFSGFFDNSAGAYNRIKFLYCDFSDSAGDPWDTLGSGSFTNFSFYACDFHDSNAQGWACTNAVSGSVVGCTFTGPLSNGISLEPGANVSIEGCLFKNINQQACGISVQPAANTGWPDPQAIRIANNVMYNVGTVSGVLADYGIRLRNTIYATVVGNVIERMGSVGIMVNGFQAAAGSADVCKYVVIADNVITDSNQRNTAQAGGILLQQDTGGTVTHVKVANNQVVRENADSHQAYAIYEAGTISNAEYSGNDTTGSTTAGFHFDVATDQTARNNKAFNPYGNITAPAVPASGSGVQNTGAVNPARGDATVFVTANAGGTCTVAIGVGSPVTAAVIPAAGVLGVRVPAGQTIALTYASAPTWTWFVD